MVPSLRTPKANQGLTTLTPRRKSYKLKTPLAYSPSPENRVGKKKQNKPKTLPLAAEGSLSLVNICTPPRSMIGNARASDLRSFTLQEIRKARKAEMKEVVVKHFRKDVSNVVKAEDLCLPVALRLQRRCALYAVKKIAVCKSSLLGPGKKRPASPIEEEFLEFVPWLTRSSVREKEELYCYYFSHFLLFLSHCIRNCLRQSDIRLLKREVGCTEKEITDYVLRLILPHIRTDINPEDSDCRDRVDVPLLTRPFNATIKMQPAVRFGIMLGVMEAKAVRGKAKEQEANEQLGRYTSQIYPNQDHRGSTWGMTCCETIVRVCHLGPDGATCSTKMDVATADGKGLKELINAIMALSFASYDKLGYDPTITYEESQWRIQVPRGINRGKRGWESTDTYVVGERLVIADKLLSEHRRLLQVYRLDDPNKTMYLLDDYWALVGVDSDDSWDEIQQQRDMTNVLNEKRPDLAGKYPNIVAGGPVYYQKNGKWVKDVAESQPPDSTKKVHRVHKRVLMEQCAKPIRIVSNIPELIIILTDVMEVYTALAKDCGVLHRSIGEENILFFGEGADVQGLLAGFENAIKKRQKKHPTTRQPNNHTSIR